MKSECPETRRLVVHPSAPAADLDGAEHAAEADLGLPSGDLAICGAAGLLLPPVRAYAGLVHR